MTSQQHKTDIADAALMPDSDAPTIRAPSLIEAVNNNFAAVGNDLDTDELKSILQERGFEIRTKQRQGMPIMSQDERVKGKRKMGIYLPKQMRVALETARLETGTSISYIIECAVDDWLTHKGLRIQ